MKHSGWKYLKSDDFDREALRLLAELPSEKLERCGALLKTPKYAEWYDSVFFLFLTRFGCSIDWLLYVQAEEWQSHRNVAFADA
jgi:hypothetical protein